MAELKRLTGRTAVPTIDMDGEIIVGWGPQASQRVLNWAARKKGQTGSLKESGPAQGEACAQDFKK